MRQDECQQEERGRLAQCVGDGEERYGRRGDAEKRQRGEGEGRRTDL